MNDRPPNGRVHGVYRLAGRRGQKESPKRRAARPYATELVCLAPLRGSCDCADFLRGSLGLCKHLLVVLGEVLNSPRRVATARAELGESRDTKRPVLRWNPVRAWRGEGDRLLGLTLEAGSASLPQARRARTARATDGDAKAWFRGGSPLPSIDGDLARRQEFLAAIDRAIKTGQSRGGAGCTSARERGARAGPAKAERPRGRASATRAGEIDQTQTLPLPTRGGRAVPQDSASALRRRHGTRQDDPGRGRVPRALPSRAPSGGAFCSYRRASRASGSESGRRPATCRSSRSTGARKSARGSTGTHSSGFLVMNYEQLLRDLRAVHRFAPEIVVLDEAQRIKNWATKSSVYVKTLSPEWRLVLTGTPMENRLEELASILDWVDDVALDAQVAARPVAHDVRGRRRARTRRARATSTRCATRLAPCTLRRVRQGGARAAAPAHRHARAGRDDRAAASRARRAHPADRAARPAAHTVGR